MEEGEEISTVSLICSTTGDWWTSDSTTNADVGGVVGVVIAAVDVVVVGVASLCSDSATKEGSTWDGATTLSCTTPRSLKIEFLT